MKGKRVIKILSIMSLVVICFVYLYSKGTYTIFESIIDGTINPDIATWSIKVNDVLVTTTDPATVDITNITWTGEHVADGKVAPGSVGVLDINIDPTDTDVAIRYDIEVIDKNINPDKLLTVHSITDNVGELVRTGISTYSGVITLDDISNGVVENITLNLEWVDDDLEIDFDEVGVTADNYLEINFRAIQYRGEEIIPYVS